MSRLNVGNLFNENEDGAPVVSGISTFSSPYYFVPPSGSTAQRPQNPGEGMIRFNTDSGHLEYYTGTHWADVITNNNELGDQNQTNSAGGTGTRGLFAGGYLASPSPLAPNAFNNVDAITVETLGNSMDFNNLTASLMGGGQCADRTRALYAGGRGPTASSADNANISFCTIASRGDYADSGFDLSTSVSCRGTSNSTRGLFGSFISPYADTLDYVTIQSLGNAQDFGNLTETRGYGMAVSSPVRAVWAGGINNPTNLGTNVIDYVTLSTTGNAQDFGDLTGNSGGAYESGNVNSSTRGVIAGGTRFNKNIDFFTIATTGNSVSFGNLDTLTRSGKGSVCSNTRGVFAGGIGDPSPTTVNTMEFITIATTGDAVDFGDLQGFARRCPQVGVSNGHGGL
jgi:hypothetical protein